MCILHIVFCTVCKYVLSICKLLFFCIIWSTLVRISLTKALVLWWCDNKSDLIWFYLIYCIYSILGRGSFCFNYCLNSAWHGGDQFVALLRWYGNPVFFDSGLQLICIFWSLVSHFPLDKTPQILDGVQVWWVCWPVKHTNTMVI